MRILLLLSVFIVTGCGLPESVSEANIFFDDFYKHRIDSGWTDTDKFYSQEFHESASTEDWNRIKNLVTNANGSVRSFEKISWNVKSNSSTNKISGTTATYTFRTTNVVGEVIETVALVKNRDNPTFKIISHNFNSPEIQKIINQGIDNVTGN